jgi:hypothetical protein
LDLILFEVKKLLKMAEKKELKIPKMIKIDFGKSE